MPETDHSLRVYTAAPIWLLVGGAFVAALIYEKREMALLCLVILLIVGLTWAWSRSLRSRLTFQTKTDRLRVFPGESFNLELTVKNGNFLPAWVRASPPFEDSLDLLDGDARQGGLNTALRWHETAHFRWALAAARRGVHRVGPSQVSAGDLLGFFPWSSPIATSQVLLVYPRLVPVLDPPLTKRDFFGAPVSRGPMEDPVYMVGTRDYQPGRPARFIHWRASARHRRFQEKVFQPSAQSKVLLVFSAAGFVASGDREGFERAIEVLASLAVAYHRQGLSVQLLSDAGAVAPGPGERGPGGLEMPLVALLERLARLLFQAGEPLIKELGREVDRLGRANMVYFSREFDAQALEARLLCQRRATPAAFLAKQRGPSALDGPGAGRVGIHLFSEISPEGQA